MGELVCPSQEARSIRCSWCMLPFTFLLNTPFSGPAARQVFASHPSACSRRVGKATHGRENALAVVQRGLFFLIFKYFLQFYGCLQGEFALSHGARTFVGFAQVSICGKQVGMILLIIVLTLFLTSPKTDRISRSLDKAFFSRNCGIVTTLRNVFL